MPAAERAVVERRERERVAGVRIQNVFRSHRVPWDLVDRFEQGTYAGPGSFRVGTLRLRDGGTISATSLNPPLGPDRTVPRLVAELGEELARRRGARSETT